MLLLVLLVAVSLELLATDPSFRPFPLEEEVLMGGAAALEADCAAEALDLVVTPIISDGCVSQRCVLLVLHLFQGR